jgi:cation-transporting P-type ATPase E
VCTTGSWEGRDVTAEQIATEGLTTAEADARRRRGEANSAVSGTTRGYATILRTNVFSFYNTVLFAIGIALLALGRYSDALISVGLGLVNALISAVQEIRAKRKLDRLQLLDRAPVLVVRDGREIEVLPDVVVRGDLLRVRAGDQIVVDGPLVDGRVEADESLLTGESEPVVKDPGDELRSGSLCVAGGGNQLAREVGADSYAGWLTTEARRVSTDKTPLQRRIEFVVRLVIALTVLMSGAILAQAALEGFSLLRVVQTTAVLSGLVPYGLFFLIAVAYTAGASRIAERGALVQQVNAVESVAEVDVVCTDKTGTLTTGRLTLSDVEPVAGRDPTPLGAFARSVTTPNLTTVALAGALPGVRWTVRDEVPFSSSLRWSGFVTDDGTWVLGAPDSLAPHPTGPSLDSPALDSAVAARTALGLRVLVFARAVEPSDGLRSSAGQPALPALEPVAVVALADELRRRSPRRSPGSGGTGSI